MRYEGVYPPGLLGGQLGDDAANKYITHRAACGVRAEAGHGPENVYYFRDQHIAFSLVIWYNLEREKRQIMCKIYEKNYRM